MSPHLVTTLNLREKNTLFKTWYIYFCQIFYWNEHVGLVILFFHTKPDGIACLLFDCLFCFKCGVHKIFNFIFSGTHSLKVCNLVNLGNNNKNNKITLMKYSIIPDRLPMSVDLVCPQMVCLIPSIMKS